jgi:HAD superfamily hydrolase (TIGR01509 family)
MSTLRAVLFDVDGVISETERDGHRVAFNKAFETKGLPWRWDESRYGDLLSVTGGRERLLSDMGTRSDAPSTPNERETLARELHRLKNGFYAELVRSAALPLRPGVLALMDECTARNKQLAIVTTTSRSNIDVLMRVHVGPSWDKRFAAVICGENVRRKKPDPEAYLAALALLKLGPLQTVAIEDSPGGVAAARAADVPTVVTRSEYFKTAPIEGAIAIGPGLHMRSGWEPPLRPAPDPQARVTLDDLESWCAQRDTASNFN